jgi:hypothetical protein
MKGLIFNLLADLAREAECEDDAWQLALAVSEEVCEELALEDEDGDLDGLLSEVSLLGGVDFTFRWLLRSGTPFQEGDWADLAESRHARSGGRAELDPFGFDLEPATRRRPDRE